MIKSARKPSSDPVQEKLRQNKVLWNKDVSTFINDLINFKKMMNGAPSKFFKEKSRIIEPIPADPTTIIGVLASDFQEIAQKGNSIITEQLNYSKNRKKKQIKPPVTTNIVAPNSTTDLNTQLAAFEIKYDLISEASNPISRFFTRLLNPTIGVSEAARIRKYRMSLLDACVKTYKDMGKLQIEIVKSSKESIDNSNKMLHQAWNDWMLVYRGFSTYKSNMPKEVPDSGGTIESPKEVKKEVENVEKEMKESNSPSDPVPGDYDYVPRGGEEIYSDTSSDVKDDKFSKAVLKDYMSILNQRALLNPNGSVFQELNSAAEKYIMNKKDQASIDRMIQEWNSLLTMFNKNFGTKATSLKDLIEIIKMRQKGFVADKKESPIDKTSAGQMEVLAQAFLKKWLGKTRHQLSLFDKTSTYRLDIFKMAKEVRKTINQIMDSLEKDMNIYELDPIITQVNRQMTSLRGLMRALHLSEK